MDEVKAKIKSASRKGRAVGLPAMLGVNLNFGPDDEKAASRARATRRRRRRPSHQRATSPTASRRSSTPRSKPKNKNQPISERGVQGRRRLRASQRGPHEPADDLDGPGGSLGKIKS